MCIHVLDTQINQSLLLVQAFVETNRCIKWCPRAGCGRAVRLPEVEQMVRNQPQPPITSHAVDCGNGHFFCWYVPGFITFVIRYLSQGSVPEITINENMLNTGKGQF